MLRYLLRLGLLAWIALPPVATAAESPAAENPFVEIAFRLGVPRDYASARGLHSMQEPERLARVGGLDALGFEQRLIPPAARAWARMRDAAAREGVELRAVSTFRSVEAQLAILRDKLAHGQTIDKILRVSAAPGYSEHHSGRAIDIATPGHALLEEEFERSHAFAWLTKNAGRYGFVLSYPRGNPQAFAYEPWHWCWHGDESLPVAFEPETVAEVDPAAPPLQPGVRYASR